MENKNSNLTTVASSIIVSAFVVGISAIIIAVFFRIVCLIMGW